MKAKEYFQKFKERQTEETILGVIGIDFFNESLEIKKARNVQFDRGFIPIMKEQDLKFRAFAKMVNEYLNEDFCKLDGFRIVTKMRMPEHYETIFPE